MMATCGTLKFADTYSDAKNHSVVDMTDTYDGQTPLNLDFPPTLLSSGCQAFIIKLLP